MTGDAILYPRADGIEAGWRVVQPFIDAWRKAPVQNLATLSRRQRGSRRGPTSFWRATAAAGGRSREVLE